MAEQRDALTELVQQQVGTHTGGDKMSVAAFCRIAVDPESGYRPSNGLIGKILEGRSYKIGPKLIGALAAGLRLDREVVAAAAHFQVIGYEHAELEEGAPAVLMRKLGTLPGDTERQIAERWAEEETGAALERGQCAQ